MEVMFDGGSSSNEILIEHVLPPNSFFASRSGTWSATRPWTGPMMRT